VIDELIASGSLLTRDFTKEVKEKLKAEELIETEFLTSLFVVVPRNESKEFQKSYESLAEMVVPRSALYGCGDFILIGSLLTVFIFLI